MDKIKLFNKIDPQGLERLPENFTITENDDYDGIILRSYTMTEAELTDNLYAVARAGAGVNNIPTELYAQKGVVVFNTPGANANAVKELTILGVLLSARKTVAGIEWLRGEKDSDVVIEKEVESKKSAFAGPELLGKKVGVVGLGAIGAKVANVLTAMEMQVYGYDPYMSVEAAWMLDSSVKRVDTVDWLFENCDFISLHLPLIDKTKKMVDKELLANAKDGINIINFARGGLVDDDAVIEAVKSGKIGCYVTDFPNNKLLGYDNIITIPHLGASTPESETNCAIMAAEEISDYLINGNIKNSVNYPKSNMGNITDYPRITINHKNIPNMVGQITATLGKNSINISNMINNSKGDFAYTMIECDGAVPDSALKDLKEIEGVLKVRKLEK